MFATIKGVLIVFLATAFMSSSFAAWNYNKNQTKCVNGHCKNVDVQKHCQNGKCWNSKHYRVWNR